MDNSEQLQILCRNIKYLRAKHGLAKMQITRNLKVSHKTLASIEAGVMPPQVSVNILYRLHRAFRSPLITLFSQNLADET